jgi:hypothetical protein
MWRCDDLVTESAGDHVAWPLEYAITRLRGDLATSSWRCGATESHCNRVIGYPRDAVIRCRCDAIMRSRCEPMIGSPGDVAAAVTRSPGDNATTWHINRAAECAVTSHRPWRSAGSVSRRRDKTQRSDGMHECLDRPLLHNGQPANRGLHGAGSAVAAWGSGGVAAADQGSVGTVATGYMPSARNCRLCSRLRRSR